MWLHPAGTELAAEALAMLRDCGEQMLERFDIPDWILPSVAEVVEADAEAGRLFIAEEAGEVLATFAVCDQADDYFAPVHWEDHSAPALYLHRLAVRPAFQASGVGSACLRYAESLSASRGARYLRLDTLAKDLRVRGFYRRAGYTERGMVRRDNPLPGRSGTELVCLEKRLSL
jgi:GNAT superfamily N-acetyltransferase